jgi:hypothetical protein
MAGGSYPLGGDRRSLGVRSILRSCAAGRIQDAIGELDMAIRDRRDVLFDHHRGGSVPSGRPG